MTEGQYIDHVRKRRKILNYYDKIVGPKQDIVRTFKDHVMHLQKRKAAEYNWPYDFFSLIEMAKIDVDVEFENKNTNNSQNASTNDEGDE